MHWHKYNILFHKGKSSRLWYFGFSPTKFLIVCLIGHLHRTWKGWIKRRSTLPLTIELCPDTNLMFGAYTLKADSGFQLDSSH